MSEGEGAEMMIAVVVAPGVPIRRHGVGTPLDHPEGQGRAGKVVAAAEGIGAGLGAGEDADVIGKIGPGRRRRGKAEHDQRRQRRDGRSQHRQNVRGRARRTRRARPRGT